MRILVTGGAGFIASHIADAYLADGHEVAVLDSLTTGYQRNVPQNAKFYEVDVRDADAVSRAFDDFRPEAVSHHAAQMDVRRSIEDPVYDASVNVSGGLNVLLSAVRVGTRRLIFASTGGAIYGEPQPEQLPLPEGFPERPESAYGLTKLAFEHYLRIWSKLSDITPVVLRYANIYGPRQTAHGEAGVVAIFAGMLLEGKQPKIFGDGTATRDYVFVRDVVQAGRAALERGDNQVINIGTGVETSTREVFDAVRAAVGSGPEEPHFAPARAGEVNRICLDYGFARENLGWNPSRTFREGVQETVEALRTQRE